MSNIRHLPRSGSLRTHGQATGHTGHGFYSPAARQAPAAVSRDELHAMIDDLIETAPRAQAASPHPLGVTPSLTAAIQAKARQNETSRPARPASKPASHALGASGGLVSAINRNKGT